jgi:hypothetical protein
LTPLSAAKAKKGSRLSYTLSEPATVKIRILLVGKGRRQGAHTARRCGDRRRREQELARGQGDVQDRQIVTGPPITPIA